MTTVFKRLGERVITTRVEDWPRIMPSLHRATPVGAGFGSSRFSSPSRAFRILYAAENFSTAFAEGVVRDRFEGKARRFLYRPHLEALCITAISSGRELNLLDLTGAATYELGLDTDANRARGHQSGQAFSEELYQNMPEVDGILFESRLTTGRCIAIYDRALSTLSAPAPLALVQIAVLPAELERLDITVRRQRGIATS